MSSVSVTPEKISSNDKQKKSQQSINLNDPIQARMAENTLTIKNSGLWMRRRSNKVRPSSR
tara:strand:+ start:4181 stop:4363 length:183 start_codon:yes stop_codon:yes gene_type:complete